MSAVGDAVGERNAATFYGSAPLYAPNSRDGRLLLEPGQTGYYVPSSVFNSASRATGNGICWRHRRHIVGQTETSSRLLDDAQPVAATLDGIAAQWQATRAELAGYVTVLAERATAIEEALKNLTANRERWTRARADAVASRAPAQVIE